MSKILVILFCTAVSEWQYINNVLATCTDCVSRMASIVNGTDVYPFVYRVLTPKLVMLLGGDLYALALFHLIGLFVFFALLYLWVEQWQRQQGILAVALATITLSVMYPTWYFSEYTLTEYILFLLALLVLSSLRRLTEKSTRSS